MTQRIFWNLGQKSEEEIKKLLSKEPMTKEKFIDKWLPYWAQGDEPGQFKADLTQLIEAEIYRYNHE